MCARVAIVYNEPVSSRYNNRGEEAAVLGVLDSVAAVHQALAELGHDVVQVPLAPPMESAKRKLARLETDVVFNLFEGFPGNPETEAEVPDVLAGLGIAYTGCPAKTLRLALDKAETSELLKAAGISTPAFQLLTPETMAAFRLNFPCIVKPVAEDASHGLSERSVASDYASLQGQVELISSAYGGQALVEEFISGREFNVTVMGDAGGTVLPISEIDYTLPAGLPEILTFEAKWRPESPYFRGTGVICPANISSGYRKNIEGTARVTYRRLGLRGYARIDLRLDKKGRFNVIDVNPNPDISPGAGTACQAAAAGMNYNQFINKIVQLALEREDDINQDSPYGASRQGSAGENIAGYARVQAGGSGGGRGGHRQLSE